MRGIPQSVRRSCSVALTATSHTRKAKGCQTESQSNLRESEARCAGSGGTHFGGGDAEAETREVRLAKGHRAGVEVTPDEEQQERHGGVVFVEDGVDHGRRKVQAQKNF